MRVPPFREPTYQDQLRLCERLRANVKEELSVSARAFDFGVHGLSLLWVYKKILWVHYGHEGCRNLESSAYAVDTKHLKELHILMYYNSQIIAYLRERRILTIQHILIFHKLTKCLSVLSCPCMKQTGVEIRRLDIGAAAPG